MFVQRAYPRTEKQPSLSCSLCLTGVVLIAYLYALSRQFIARYVHDLIVKHNVRDLSDYPD